MENVEYTAEYHRPLVRWICTTSQQASLAEEQGDDFQKILVKLLSLAYVFPKFMLSLSKVMKLRFSQNFKFNSPLQY